MRTIKRAIGHDNANVTIDILKQMLSSIHGQWDANAMNIIMNEAINETLGNDFVRTGAAFGGADRRPRPAKRRRVSSTGDLG